MLKRTVSAIAVILVLAAFPLGKMDLAVFSYDDSSFSGDLDGLGYGDWPMFHYGNCNRGYSSFETTFEGLTEPHLIWSYDLPNEVKGSPVVADVDRDGKKEIFIDNSPFGALSGGTLYCLNESGQIRWIFDPVPDGGAPFSTPAIGDIDGNGFDEILYWSRTYRSDPSYHQELYCLEPNGTLRWSYPASGRYGFFSQTDEAMPTIADVTGDGTRKEILVQHSNDRYLYCINFDGGQRWKYAYADGAWYEYMKMHVAPAVADFNDDGLSEIVASGGWWNVSDQGVVFCVDSSGNLLWSRQDIIPCSRQSAWLFGSSPAIDDLDEDGALEIVVGGKTGVWCLNQTGETLWFYSTPEVACTIAVADIDNNGAKEIVFGALDNYVYCLNSTGGLEWKYLTGDKVLSSPAIADIEKPAGGEPGQLEIVVGSLDGKLYCLNSTGGLLWTYNAGASIYSSPAIVDLQYSGEGNPEIIFAASNKLYALRVTPAHDVAITSVSPHSGPVGQGTIMPVQVTVKNKGDYSETFNVTLYADETAIQTKTVANLSPYANTVLSFEWNTTGFSIGSLYVIKAVADSVSEEYHTIDNTLVGGLVVITSPVHDIAVTDVTLYNFVVNEGTDLEIYVRVENQGNMRETFNVTVYANETEIQTIALIDMNFETTQILDFTWNTAGFSLGDYTITATASVVTGETQTSDNTYIDGMVSIFRTVVYVYPQTTRVQPNETFTIDVRIADVIDLLMWQIELHFNSTVLTWVSGGSVGEGYVSYQGLFTPSFNGSCTLLQITFKGRTTGISQLHFSETETFLFDSDFFDISFSAVDGVAKVVQHEIAVTQVNPYKSTAGQGYPIKINATIENIGYYTETFNVTLYANTTIIGQTEVTLTSGDSTTTTFSWNTTGFTKGNYNISAEADVVPGEIDTNDNILIDGTVYVGIPGDITAQFGLVDMKDIGDMVRAFGSIPGHPKWNPNADINDDGLVDMKDIGIAVRHFGEVDP